MVITIKYKQQLISINRHANNNYLSYIHHNNTQGGGVIIGMRENVEIIFPSWYLYIIIT
jgi:hypothetical protein